MLEDILKGLNPIEEGNFRYYEIDKFFDVSINTIDSKAEIPPHEHEQDVHNYVLSGQITIITNDGEESLTKGDWVFIQAGKQHSVRTTEPVTLLEFWKK